MNNLVKPLICIFFVAAFSYNGYGQRIRVVERRNALDRMDKPNAGRRMELVKEGFISRQLKLTPEESKAFWPLYHQYVREMTAVRVLKRANNSSNTPDGPEQVDKELAYEQQLVEIRKHYKEEYQKILPPEKLSELYKSERLFNDEVLKQLSERTIPATQQ